MSHELTIHTNGKVEMAYTGELAWHGLGQYVPSNATIDEWLRAGGMEWTIKRGVVRFATARPGEADSDPTASAMGLTSYPDRVVLFRSDNKMPLSVVSDGYKVVQPREIVEFFRDLVQGLGFTMETVGTLFDGRKFWALAKVTSGEAIVHASDKVGGYLLLSTSCDGSMATQARWTTVRVVCNNTLGMARSAAADISITHRSKFDPAKLKAALGVDTIHEQFGETMQTFRELAHRPMSPGDMGMATAALLTPAAKPIATLATDEIMALLQSKAAMQILTLTGSGRGAALPGVKDTAWGWLNAVTEYVDHTKRSKTDSNRLDSALFGQGDSLKTRAFEIAMVGSGLARSTVYADVGGVDAVAGAAAGAGLLDSIVAGASA